MLYTFMALSNIGLGQIYKLNIIKAVKSGNLICKCERNILNDGNMIINNIRFGSKIFCLHICAYIYSFTLGKLTHRCQLSYIQTFIIRNIKNPN